VSGGGITLFEEFAAVGVAQHAGTLAAVAALAARRGGLRRALGLQFRLVDAWWFPAGAAMGVALSFALVVIVKVFLGGDAPVQQVVEAAGEARSPGTVAAVVLVAVVLAPLAEEVLFRGVLVRALQRNAGERVVVYVSAAIFAAIHVLFDPGALLASVALFALGAVLARLVLASDGRLGKAVLAHAGFNALAVIALLLN
jgi:membrane protease YdiL (CAAX protease family)